MLARHPPAFPPCQFSLSGRRSVTFAHPHTAGPDSGEGLQQGRAPWPGRLRAGHRRGAQRAGCVGVAACCGLCVRAVPPCLFCQSSQLLLCCTALPGLLHDEKPAPLCTGDCPHPPTPRPTTLPSPLPCRHPLPAAGNLTACSDVAPDSQFTCAEQKDFGKCDQPFMIRGAYCLQTCGRCGGGCTDNPPPESKFSCDQQEGYGQCTAEFMWSGPWWVKRRCGGCCCCGCRALLLTALMACAGCRALLLTGLMACAGHVLAATAPVPAAPVPDQSPAAASPSRPPSVQVPEDLQPLLPCLMIMAG